MTRIGEPLAVSIHMVRTLGLASFALAGCIGGCIDDRDVQLPDEPVQSKTVFFDYFSITA